MSHLPSQAQFYIKQHIHLANTETFQPKKGVLPGDTKTRTDICS